ncbi:alternative oxidase-domain-containing protein [Thamnocephalis sphaerospora]|uniref:Alternative oxidase n=1 Tax=Thamnocephalis sphaerospora TaxID=78915 RepID=A0A4P9XXA0_9FUNG|nr:alternative oxidase-domain-containing protein [Thamnocephalis sphaerospora]|eukprot:RKP10927.1 alternative oxidase-domain-containing protein [Thamnocephalis sphaerospora]
MQRLSSQVRCASNIPHSFPPHNPSLVRDEFLRPLDTSQLENLDIALKQHRKPENVSDWIAHRTVKAMRVVADAFFRKRYLHRAVTLETVAAVPGMVAGMHRHLHSLRWMRHDGGWISHLLAEAENERMHLLTWMRVTNPTLLERGLIFAVQGGFFSVYFLLYLFAPKTAHRVVGYLEEEAIVSYTQMLQEIDNGNIPNLPAPQIAIDYWNMRKDATLRDVTLAVRADEAMHRDTNHDFADRLLSGQENLRVASGHSPQWTTAQPDDAAAASNASSPSGHTGIKHA